MRHFISIADLSNEQLIEILDLADDLADGDLTDISRNVDVVNAFDKRRKRGRPVMARRVMATLFYEPSTRTRLSFEAAMLRLGGRVIGFSDARTSSVAKGESLCDTIRTVGGYVDLLVLRHGAEGAPLVASTVSPVPIVNAGDGAREHPTQCLLDLFTLRREKGRIAGLKVGLCGDLRYGRTVHSLAQALARLGAEPIFIAPACLVMPTSIVHYVTVQLERAPIQTEDPYAVFDQLDCLYMTRIQQERFERKEDYLAVKDTYVLDASMLAKLRSDTVVLHPLPRVDEIHPEVDGDPRCLYFRQAQNGIPVRMALLALLLSSERKEAAHLVDVLGRHVVEGELFEPSENRCDNPRCILRIEPYLKPRLVRCLDGEVRCAYCEMPMAQEELALAPPGR